MIRKEILLILEENGTDSTITQWHVVCSNQRSKSRWVSIYYFGKSLIYQAKNISSHSLSRRAVGTGRQLL